MLRGISPQSAPHFFNEESFVCVSVETKLDADSDTAFLDRAVDFANGELWGTLAASITLPSDFRKDPAREAALQSALSRLDYGTIAINHWSGLAFAMMSPGWGGVAGSTLDDAQGGIGWVHNTYQLDGIEKNVLTGPLTMSPKPSVVCDPLQSGGGRLAAPQSVRQAVAVEPGRCPRLCRHQRPLTRTQPSTGRAAGVSRRTLLIPSIRVTVAVGTWAIGIPLRAG